MRYQFKLILIATFFSSISLFTHASAYKGEIKQAIEQGFFFGAIPWVKEYLVNNSGKLDESLESSFEKLLSNTGVQLFEKLPAQYLRGSRSNYVKYILAKQNFKKNNFEKTIKLLSSISSRHPISAFAIGLKASSYYMLGSYQNALGNFDDCIDFSKKISTRNKEDFFKKQVELNEEICRAGIARTHFAMRDFKKTNIAYSAISKNSYIWPELLFEEAWNSYYLKDYNRSLGKVVSYNAPIFNNIFKPEVFSLQAVSYLKMCHYQEAQNIAERFQRDYQKPGRLLRKYLQTRGNDFRYYYKLMNSYEQSPNITNPFFYKVLSSISKNPVYQELKSLRTRLVQEKKHLTARSSSNLYGALRVNLQNSLYDIQQLMGENVRDELLYSYQDLYQTSQAMSFIKLEILKKRKSDLYGKKSAEKKGDYKELKRNRFQYFWKFNGEFWADEIGDYVFALKSKCSK